jgi:hypothetical protein
MMTLAKRSSWWLFLATAALIYSIIYFVVRTPQGMSHTALISAAALFDLSVTSSFACYMLLVRTGYCSWRTVAVVGLGGLRAAGLLLPEADQQYLPSLQWVSVPLELVFVAAIIRRFRRVPSDDDVLARIRSAASAIIPDKRLARLVAAEIIVLYYALFSWRAKPERSRDAQAFSCAETSGYRLFGTLLLLLIICEGVPLHFLLWRYNTVAAWICTGLDVYGLLWAVALIRSVQLRMILVDNQSIKIRIGMLWEAEIPRENIMSCQRLPFGTVLAKTPDYLKAVVLNDPQYILHLKQPAIAVGLYGRHRTFTQIGLAVDQAQTFLSALGLDG